ncbi:21318_t:CDS:2 [Entrophospora sp. SA101]|nr:21318_t:CDS:2 [Entrophospora sp. SA101]
MLKELRNVREKLRVEYFFSGKLPDTYFNFPKPRELLPFSPKDSTRIKGILYIQKLPNNYFTPKPRLPNSPDNTIFNYIFPITEQNTANEFIKEARRKYEIIFPINKKWINVPKTNTKNKPFLPKNINELDAQFIVDEEIILPITIKTNIRNIVIKLGKKYFFKRIPDEWISIEKTNDNIDTPALEISNIERKQLPDLTTTTQELDKYNIKITIPIIDDKKIHQTTQTLKKLYIFKYLPDTFINLPPIPNPEDINKINITTNNVNGLKDQLKILEIINEIQEKNINIYDGRKGGTGIIVNGNVSKHTIKTKSIDNYVTSIDELITKIIKTLNENKTKKRNTIVMGDFNAIINLNIDKTPPSKKNNNKSNLIEFLIDKNYIDTQKYAFDKHTEHTWQRNASSSRIDFIWVDNNIFDKITKINKPYIPNYKTDHKCLSIDLNIKIKNWKTTSNIERYVYNWENTKQINNYKKKTNKLAAKINENKSILNNIESLWSLIKYNLIKASDKKITKTKITNYKNTNNQIKNIQKHQKS